MAELLKAHPNGLTSGELREKLQLGPTEQAQLDRRRRDLKKFYVIEKSGVGHGVRYIYRGERTEPLTTQAVNQKARAQVLHQARGRCAMCGRSTEKHGIALAVDHKIPQDWGGTNEIANLWALCKRGHSFEFRFHDSDGTVRIAAERVTASIFVYPSRAAQSEPANFARGVA